jgi:hypothetical protein
VDRVGRAPGARGGADNCGHDQENLRDTDTDAAKEKDFHSDQKEIAHAHAELGKEIFPEPDTHGFTATEEETFAHTQTERDTRKIDIANAHAKFNAFAAIEEETFAYTHAERDAVNVGNANSNSDPNAFAHTDRDAGAFALGITEKAWRTEREPDAGPDQRL